MKGSLFVCFVLLLVGYATAASSTFQCPAGHDCSGMCDELSVAKPSVYGNSSSFYLPCPLGFLCEQDQEPVRCPRRHYCPTPTLKINCPSGHYCIKGLSVPRKCPSGAVCPENSWKYIFVLGIILCVVTHAVFGLIYFVIKKLSNHTAQPARELTEVTKGGSQKIPLNFAFQDLQVRVRTGKLIKLFGRKKSLLQGVSGKFEAGKLAAIMGPSGAGKSTFVNVLLGKVAKSSGSILINGIESSRHNIRTAIGYVPQEDVMLREGVTVRDILLHSAVTRLPRSWSKADIETKVDDVLRLLKLEHVQNNFIGDEIKRGLSGGERKKVNIGMELVADPTAIVCDEPTSGLDSTSAYEVMSFLKQIAKEHNITVIVVLHQPRTEIFDLVDDLLLLSKGGYTTYIGPAHAAKEYFSNLGYACPQHVNPADHFIDLMSDQQGLQRLIESWQRNERDYIGKATKGEKVPSTSAPFYRQFAAYTKRAFLQLFRDVSGRMVDNFMHLLAGAIIALGFVAEEMFVPPIPREYLPFCPPSVTKAFCWYPEVSVIGRLPIYTSLAVGLAASTIGVRSFYNERSIFWRETASGTNTLMYFLAKNIVDLVPICFYALTFTSAFVTVATPWGSFGWYLLAIILYEFCLYPVGYICGLLIDNNPSVLAVIVALLSGLGTETSVPIMWSRYSSEILFNNELDYDGQPSEIKPLVKDYTETAFGYSIDSREKCVVALVLIGIGLRVLAYVLMRITKRDKQK